MIRTVSLGYRPYLLTKKEKRGEKFETIKGELV